MKVENGATTRAPYVACCPCPARAVASAEEATFNMCKRSRSEPSDESGDGGIPARAMATTPATPFPKGDSVIALLPSKRQRRRSLACKRWSRVDTSGYRGDH